MITPRLSQLFIYPVKGLGGISLQQSKIAATGLQYDRRWMLVDENGVFLTQRTHPKMALFKAVQTDTGFEIYEPAHLESILIPYACEGAPINVKIWDDSCEVVSYHPFADEWFSLFLGNKCKLVYMPDACERLVDTKYVKRSELVSFADAYPMLLIGEESLRDLNSRLIEPVLMDRFRPNFVVSGTVAFEEDTFSKLAIGRHSFEAVKPCARCTVTTVNQQSGEMGKEPLKTLATYRSKDNKTYFGENLVSIEGSGTVKVGDQVVVSTWKEPVIG